MEVFNLHQAVWLLITRVITGVNGFLTAAGLAQSVERLYAEREVASSILQGRTITQGQLRNEGTPFALQAAWPSRGSGAT